MNTFQTRLKSDVNTILNILSVTHQDLPSAVLMASGEPHILADILVDLHFSKTMVQPCANEIRIKFTVLNYGKIDIMVSNSYVDEEILDVLDYGHFYLNGQVHFHIYRLEEDCLYPSEDRANNIVDHADMLQNEYLIMRAYSTTLFHHAGYKILEPREYKIDG